MTTLDEILNVLNLIQMDWQFIHGCSLRLDYVATDMRAEKRKYEMILENDMAYLKTFPDHWVEAAKIIYDLRRR